MEPRLWSIDVKHIDLNIKLSSMHIAGDSFWWRGRRTQRMPVQQQNDVPDNSKWRIFSIVTGRMHLNILIVTWPTEKDRQSQAVHPTNK